MYEIVEDGCKKIRVFGLPNGKEFWIEYDEEYVDDVIKLIELLEKILTYCDIKDNTQIYCDIKNNTYIYSDCYGTVDFSYSWWCKYDLDLIIAMEEICNPCFYPCFIRISLQNEKRFRINRYNTGTEWPYSYSTNNFDKFLVELSKTPFYKQDDIKIAIKDSLLN